MTIVIILIVVAVIAGGAYFALARKPPTQLPVAEKRAAELPSKPTVPAAPTARDPLPTKPDRSSAAPTQREREESVKPPAVASEEKARPPVSAPPPSRPKRDVTALRKGLAASRGGFIAKLRALVTGKKDIDPAILEQMEEVMLSSDVGVQTTQAILRRLRERLDKNELTDETAVWEALRAEAVEVLSIGDAGTVGALKNAGKPSVVLMVGVNGVGKTTTIGKLATRYTSGRQEGRPGRGRHLPRGGGAAARGVGQARRCRRGQAAKREPIPAPWPSTRRRRPRRRGRLGPGRHRGPPPHEGAADGRDQEGAKDHRQGARRRSPRDASRARRDDRSERARPRRPCSRRRSI
jgi:hypothetical protein